MAPQPDEQLDAGNSLKIPSYTTTPVDQIPVVRQLAYIHCGCSYLFRRFEPV